MSFKTCPKCKIIKSFGDFFREKDVKTNCNICDKLRKKEIYFKKSKEYRRKVNKKRYGESKINYNEKMCGFICDNCDGLNPPLSTTCADCNTSRYDKIIPKDN